MRKRWLQVIHKLAKENPNIIFIGSDLSADPAIKAFQEEVPQQFFMEGIAEAHIIGMAAGLAMNGKTVYINTIATFITRRCFEQNVIDLGLANTKVRLLGSGGGLVYAPLGPTHLAIDDIAIMRAIPNMTVIAPTDADEMERALLDSVDYPGPIYFRVAKGGDPIVSRPELGFQIGKAIVYRPSGQVQLITTGIMLNSAIAVADELKATGISVGITHVPTLKPFDAPTVAKQIAQSKLVFTLEEHLLSGGLGTLVSELIAEDTNLRSVIFKRIGLPDLFPDTYGSQESLLEKYGCGKATILNEVRSRLSMIT